MRLQAGSGFPQRVCKNPRWLLSMVLDPQMHAISRLGFKVDRKSIFRSYISWAFIRRRVYAEANQQLYWRLALVER